MRGYAAGASLALWLSASSCAGDGSFACSDDTQCQIDTATGVCSNGSCAFDDPTCPSGLRFSEHAAGELAGSCVPMVATSGSTGPGDTTRAPATTTTDGDTTAAIDGGSDTSTGGDGSQTTSDSTGAPADWWNENWPYRVSLTIDPSVADADLVDFPYAISWEASAELAELSDGQDLVFVHDGVVLAHEVESYEANGGLAAWVSLPTLSSRDSTQLWLYFGRGDRPKAPSDAVWDEQYGGVWHLAGSPGGVVEDSSGNLNQGTPVATIDDDGLVGGGARFDGISSRVSIAPDPTLTAGSSYTYSAWVNADGFAVDAGPIITHAQTYGGSPNANTSYLRAWENALVFFVRLEDGNQLSPDYFDYGADQIGQWHHVAATYDGGTARLYFDGQEVASEAAMGTLQSVGHGYTIGGWDSGTALALSTRTWIGRIDEARISTVARSAAWIAACHRSQGLPDQYLTVGRVQTLP